MDINLVQNIFDKGDYRKVLDLVKDDTTIEAHYFKERSLSNLGYIEEAIGEIVNNKELFEKELYWKVIYNLDYSTLLWNKGLLDKALDFVKIAFELSNNLDDQRNYDPFENKLSLQGLIIQRIGVIYDNKGDYKKALQYGLQALELRKKSNDLKGIVNSCLNIGYVYELRGYTKEAFKYYEEGRILAEKHNFKRLLSVLYANLCSIYGNKGDLAKAIEYALKSITICEEIQDISQNIAFAYMAASECYFEVGDVKNGEKYFEKLRIISEKNSVPRIKEVYLYQKAIRLKKSKRLLQKAEAEKILRDFVSKPRIRKGLTILALKHLLELLLLEYKMTQEEEALKEFKSYLQEIERIAIDQQIWGTLISVLQLKARLHVIEGEYDKAVLDLEEAIKISLENEMDNYLENIKDEKENIEKDFKKMQHTIQLNENLAKKLTDTNVMDYIVSAIKLVK